MYDLEATYQAWMVGDKPNKETLLQYDPPRWHGMAWLGMRWDGIDGWLVGPRDPTVQAHQIISLLLLDQGAPR